MKSRLFIGALFIAIIIIIVGTYMAIRNSYDKKIAQEISQYSGSLSCKPCHERFYELWASSFHGLAMQPVTAEFVKNKILNYGDPVKVGDSMFEVVRKGDTLYFTETDQQGGENVYPAIHTMGGKYIYYFLTEFDRGRLHVLPLAYDSKSDSWYNNPESGVRHFETIDDSPLDWKNHLYTFNTSCYNCHVSQLKSNFNIDDLTYNTTWNEPGINCETCHGPSSEHVRVCVEAGEENVPDDLKIIVTSDYTPDQHNSACGSCHGKTSIVAPGYPPGEKFNDYFSLITLENHDFYADGRDLGENYTMTSWAMNRCQISSEMHCVTCHTSSGRYRFGDENPNNACASCHPDKTDNVTAHSNHKEESEGSICISCHMPKTTFARMDRSDHSFRPPMPEATIEFGSPNACNICHSDRSPEWANNIIKKTHTREYQKKTILEGKLIRESRAGDWQNLDMIIEGLNSGSFDEVFATSFIRLLEQCDDDRKWEVIFKKTYDTSPLVRSAAARAMNALQSEKFFARLVQMAGDEFRIVRLNAAYSLSYYPQEYIQMAASEKVTLSIQEYVNSLTSLADDWSSHYNLGNYYNNLGDYNAALEAYNRSIKIYPEAIMPMVNAGFIYSVTGNTSSAEIMFERVLSFSQDNEAALLNLALLYGESGESHKAIDYFRRLLHVTDNNAVAAYNLSILVSGNDPGEALELSRMAYQWEPDNNKYSYTYAYNLFLSDNFAGAEEILISLTGSENNFIDAYYLLANIYSSSDRNNLARELLNGAITSDSFNDQQKQYLLGVLKSIGE